MLQRKERDRWLGMKKLFFIIYIRWDCSAHLS